MLLLKNIRQSFDIRSTVDQIPRDYVKIIATLDTPKVILEGDEAQSNGFMVNGTVQIKPIENVVNLIQIKKFNISLIQHVTYSKPFIFNDSIIAPCPNCRYKTRVIKDVQLTGQDWDDDLVYIGTNIEDCIPFSFLVPGDLPSTLRLGTGLDTVIRYDLRIKLEYVIISDTISDPGVHSTVLKTPLTIARTLKAVQKTYLRKFGSTSIQARVIVPSAAHASSAIPFHLSLRGVQSTRKSKKMAKRWSIVSVSWKICEIGESTEDPCAVHAPLLEELKNRLNSAKNPWKLKTAKASTIEVSKDIVALDYRYNQDDLIYGDRLADEDIINNGAEDDLYHPLDPDNPMLNNHVEPFITAKSHKSESEGTLLYSEERCLLSGQIRSGWKNDYTHSGTIQLETAIKTTSLVTGGIATHTRHIDSDNQENIINSYKIDMSAVNCCVDIAKECHDQYHFAVFHKVYLDIEVSEEEVNLIENTTRSTGIKKMLKMDFPIAITERNCGIVAWENDVPPAYSKLCKSPPEYCE